MITIMYSSKTNKHKAKVYHCFHCRHGFQSQELLDEHNEKGCMAVEGQQIEMPDESDTMVFKNQYKKLKAPLVIYADFECLTTRTGTVSTKEVKTDQHHRPCGFMINVINAIDGTIIHLWLGVPLDHPAIGLGRPGQLCCLPQDAGLGRGGHEFACSEAQKKGNLWHDLWWFNGD